MAIMKVKKLKEVLKNVDDDLEINIWADGCNNYIEHIYLFKEDG